MAGLRGVGSKGWGDNMEGGDVCRGIRGANEPGERARPQNVHCELRSFSSWRRAKAISWSNMKACKAWTFQWMFDDKPEMEQLSKKGGGRPMILLASASNYVK